MDNKSNFFFYKKSNHVAFNNCSHMSSITECRNPTLAKCGGEAQHLEKVGIGVVATLAFGLRLRQGG
jgi:hypothetical protein